MLKDNCFQPFKNKWDELSVEQGCILWGYRTIIPTKMHALVLLDLHRSHLGLAKTKALATSYIWWPNLDNDIEKLLKICQSCQSLQANPEKSRLIPWEPENATWKRIHIDFAGPIKGYQLLIIVDSFSNWVEVFKTSNATSEFVISKLRETISRYGLVDVIVSDNGSQFTSDRFKIFGAGNSIKHITTAPGHPTTNGKAENFVKTLKKAIFASMGDKNNEDIDSIIVRFLVDYRNTRHCTTNETPAKLLFGRELKTNLSLLRPPCTKDVIKINNRLT